MLEFSEEEFIQETDKFTAVIGVIPGYFHGNDVEQNMSNYVGRAWQLYAEAVFRRRGIYVSAVIKPCITVYNTEWGCPEGGELTVEITGVRNPEFVQDSELYKISVTAVIKCLKELLKQSTVTLEFSTTKVMYLKD